MRKIIILSGPSGVGKTTIYQEYIKLDNTKAKKVTTITTRPKRINEIDGKDYYFVSIVHFKNLIKENKLIEYAKVHNNFYGSTYEELENIISKNKIPIYIVDPQGATSLKNILYGKYDIKTVFILPPNEKELKNRLIKRGEDENCRSFQIRFNESLKWLKEKDKYDYNIVNDHIENAIKKFKEIVDFY